MNFRRICIVIIQILFSVSTFSQIDSTFKDTVKEIIIYEYDTVYIAADTIWLTYTIIDIEKTNTVKKKKFVFPRFSFKKLRSFLFPIIPNSYGINVAPFVAGNLQEKIVSDSLSSQAVINTSFSMQMNYYSRKYILSIGAGFTPYHEKHHFQRTYYSSNIQTNTFEPYDSLLINMEYSADYYYNYLNLNVLFGRKLKLNKKLFLNLNLGFTADYLIDYKQGNTNIPLSSVRKFDISFIISPHLVYKKNRRSFEFYLSPFYQHSILQDDKYPKTTFQKMGIEVGFNKILKKRRKR